MRSPRGGVIVSPDAVEAVARLPVQPAVDVRQRDVAAGVADALAEDAAQISIPGRKTG